MKILIQIIGAFLGVLLIYHLYPSPSDDHATHAAIGGLCGFAILGGWFGSGILYDKLK